MEYSEQRRVDYSRHPVEASTSPSIARVLARLGLSETKALSGRTTEQLVAALHDARWERRASAATALGQVGILGPIDPLVIALHDNHEAVRAAAARALGSRGDTSPISILLTALQDHHPLVREAAATALGRVGTSCPIDPFVIALQDDHEEVRAAAVQALGRRGDKTLISLLLIALQDHHPLVREAAAIALGELRNYEARLPLLNRLLQDEEILVRDAITQSLLLLEQDVFQDFITIFLQEKEPSIQEMVGSTIDELIDLGLNAHEKIASIAPLAVALQSVDKGVQKAITCYLIGRGLDLLDERIPVAPLIDILHESSRDESSQEGVWRTFRSLTRETLRERKIIRLLMISANDPDATVRMEINQAIRWLINLALTLHEERSSEEVSSVEDIQAILQNKNNPVYEATLYALIKQAFIALEEREPIEVLLTGLRESDAQTRMEVGQKLTKRAKKAYMGRIPGGPLIISLKNSHGLSPVELQFGDDQKNTEKEGRPVFPWDGPISPRLTLPSLPDRSQDSALIAGNTCCK
jgi:HEAT repeats/HEAT repeat